MTAKPILVSGIKPEGPLHLGNFLGSLKNFVELQNSNKYNCFFFIADLHSLTEEFDHRKKQAQVLELTAEYLSAGLDPQKSAIFLQSAIPAHTELMWLLTVITPEGDLRRMTQFKDKALVKKQNVNTGLLMYPVLMAADILLYDAAFVPVGEDQLQHLELTRTLARKFNRRFGRTFLEPKPILASVSRVMSLGNPEKKMSKSQPETCLFLDDAPEDIRAKVKRAVTDSGSEIKYDPEKKPAIANLLGIYAALAGAPIPALQKKFSGANYAQFKHELAELVIERFAGFRKRKAALLKKPETLKKVLRRGSGQAAKAAENKINEVKKRVGIAL